MKTTENWAAFVNNGKWGLGVVNFDTDQIIGGFNGEKNNGDTGSANCGYLAPTKSVQLPYNVHYVYNYSLILGYVDDIRSIVYQLHDELN